MDVHRHRKAKLGHYPPAGAASVADVRKWALSALLCKLALLAAFGGCASTGGGDFVVDVMFRKTGAVAPDVIEITSPGLVNEIHGAFTIEAVGLYAGAQLEEDGRVGLGSNRVFLLEFRDHGDISLLRSDDKRVSLRAELGSDGKVVKALLGSKTGAVVSGFKAEGNDAFESGTWELLYDGPEIVVGRFDLTFEKYRVAGNFRAPRLR